VGAAVIVEAVRTPIGRRGGVLSGLHATEISDASTALVTMCAGGAMSTATIIERI
jgi:acetyl-CoA C-acetyltransferase